VRGAPRGSRGRRGLRGEGGTAGAGDEAQWRERWRRAGAASRARLQLEAMRYAGGAAGGGVGQCGGDTELAQVKRQQQETLQEYDRLRADVERDGVR